MKKNTTYRINKILNLIPKDVKTVLDIGSRGEIFNKKYKTTTVDALEDADITQDLNKNQKLPFKDNSFDVVVMNQILEHLPNCEEIIKEAKRVSKKYIFVGLPNELILSNRWRFLFENTSGAGDGYYPLGHKHFFRINTIEDFILKFFRKYEKKDYVFVGNFASLIPKNVKSFLAKAKPTFFAGQINYLIRVK
jgi:predicted SAM-dependent methyltransferase